MTLLIWLVAGGLLGYGTYAVLTWWEYGDHVGSAPLDPRLDKFIPDWEVGERHETPVQAPSDQTWHAVRTVDLEDSWLIRLIFRVRQVFMRGRSRPYDGPRNVLDRALAMGWGVLAEVPGQVIVMGAVTRPWTANPVFRALPAGEFASFNEPGYAKIVWSIGAEPLGWNASSACTETRVTLTDPESRRRFRLYWSLVAPGVRLIRHVLVRRARRAAEGAAVVSPEAGDSSAGFGHRPQSPRRVSRSAG